MCPCLHALVCARSLAHLNIRLSCRCRDLSISQVSETVALYDTSNVRLLGTVDTEGPLFFFLGSIFLFFCVSHASFHESVVASTRAHTSTAMPGHAGCLARGAPHVSIAHHQLKMCARCTLDMDTDNKLRNNHKLIHEYFTHFLAHDQIVANFPVSFGGL